jgi:hypothetical protein
MNDSRSRRLRPSLAALLTLALIACAEGHAPAQLKAAAPGEAADPSPAFDYRWEDPFVATVVGTPPDQRASLPMRIPERRRRLAADPDRRAPGIFWYDRGLKYTLAAQSGPASLVIIISGTGGSDVTRSTGILSRVLFSLGYHVLALPSPSHPNFIVNASPSGLPGRIGDDARDLYQVMQRALADAGSRVDIRDISLAGYSLGAWQAAFVARIDDEERRIGFRNILMINPPVSLYRSLHIVDRLLVDNLDGGLAGVPAFVDRVFRAIAAIETPTTQTADFGGDFLYEAYIRLQPQRRDLAALIGLVFRLIAADLAFAADAMNGGGYVIPAGARLPFNASLTNFLATAVSLGFNDYLDRLLLPRLRERDPALTRDDLIREETLEAIAGYLSRAVWIGLITNADDFIYAPGDLDFLQRVFAERAVVFPRGGHCGNMDHPQVIDAMRRVLER